MSSITTSCPWTLGTRYRAMLHSFGTCARLTIIMRSEELNSCWLVPVRQRRSRMGHAAPSASLTHVALARLDHLIGEIKHSQSTETDLLLEHLHGARIYLLG